MPFFKKKKTMEQEHKHTLVFETDKTKQSWNNLLILVLVKNQQKLLHFANNCQANAHHLVRRHHLFLNLVSHDCSRG